MTVLALAYVLLLYGSVMNNVFGLDGHGMKAYLLAPIQSRTILAMKNLAVTLIIAAQCILLLAVNQLVFHDLSLESAFVGLLAFITAISLMTGFGNLVSIQFPRSSPFGKRLEASPWAVLAMFLEVPISLLPIGVALLLGAVGASLVLKYALMSAGTLLALGIYRWVLLPRAALHFDRRAAIVAASVSGGNP